MIKKNGRNIILYFLFFLVISHAWANESKLIISNPSNLLYEDTLIFFEIKESPYNQFRWEFGDGTIETGGKKMDHIYKARGLYKLTIKSLAGNKPPVITQDIKIVRDIREIEFIGDKFFPGISIKMQAKNFIYPSLLWDFGDGHRQLSSKQISHTYNNSGTYTISIIDRGGKGLKTITRNIVIKNDDRSLSMPQEIIAGESVAMQLKNAAGGNYTWEFSDGQKIKGQSIQSIFFKNPGKLTVVIKDNSKILPPLTKQIIIKQDTRHIKSSLSFALPNETIKLEAKNFRGPKIHWDFGDGIKKIKGNTIITHRFKNRGKYTIKARDFNGKSLKTFTAKVMVSDLTPDFQLQNLEMAFENGKYYQVVPLKNRPPSYYVKMKYNGRGTLKGQWILDGQTIGLFQVLCKDQQTAHLTENQIITLPMTDLGIHNLTLIFSNYNFQSPIPTLRYFITEADVLRILSPKPDEKITKKASATIRLKWEPIDHKKVKESDITYQLLISKIPIQFLRDDQIKWKEVGIQSGYSLPLKYIHEKGKDHFWVYWQVRALKPSGDILTISDISSFKILLQE